MPFNTEDWTARIRAQSPSGPVPAHKHRELVINDPLALAEYLAERHPADAQLWPTDPATLACARAAAAEMNSGFTTLRSALPINFRLQRTGPTRDAAAEEDIRHIMEIWRDCCERYAAYRTYLFSAFCISIPDIWRIRRRSVRGLHGCNLDPSLDD